MQAERFAFFQYGNQGHLGLIVLSAINSKRFKLIIDDNLGVLRMTDASQSIGGEIRYQITTWANLDDASCNLCCHG